MDIKILQWNIWYQEKVDSIVDVIRDISPDIACLQELSSNTEANPNINTDDVIKSELVWESFVEISQRWEGWHKDYQANGIFSKYPVISRKFKYLRKPHSVDVIDWSKEGRGYLETDIDVAGKILTVGTTHLSYTDGFSCGQDRDEEEGNLRSILQEKNRRYFFSGDLNTPPDSPLLTFLKEHLKHCGPDLERKTWTTKPFEYRGFKEDSLNWRLDYAFATEDVKVVNSYVYDTDVSDHLPVVIELEI